MRAAPVDSGSKASRSIPRLGIGLTYQPGLHQAMAMARDTIDFLEISPDILCQEQMIHGRRVLQFQETLLREALSWCERYPCVVHGLGLSIGSASGWNDGYLKILDSFVERCDMVWHSEHLGFLHIGQPDGTMLHAGVQLPMPFTEEALDLLVPRIQALIERYGRPFLIENTTHYLAGLPTSTGLDEVSFLNELSHRSGCGLLLDLYNFHCNAVNFGFDAKEALSTLALDRVREVHIAGGASAQGYIMDVHSDVVPEPVWSLLDWLVPRAPNLGGIVYELLEQAIHVVGPTGVRDQLERAKAVLRTGHDHSEELPCVAI